jgi:hypothetical protein
MKVYLCHIFSLKSVVLSEMLLNLLFHHSYGEYFFCFAGLRFPKDRILIPTRENVLIEKAHLLANYSAKFICFF